MAGPKSKPSEPIYSYHPVPPHPDDPQPPNYVVLSPAVLLPPLRPRRSQWQCRLTCTAALLLLAAAVYLLWPSDPDVSVERLRLDHLRIHTWPHIAIDISLALTVKVRNKDFYSIDYESVKVSIGYRGKRLAHVRSGHGHVPALVSSFVDAKLDFDGIEVLSDAIFLLEDLAKGVIPFDTATKVEGQIGFFFFQFPLHAKLSCEVFVSTINQTVLHQNCYSE
ncbi:uncharacterized protein LOC131157620 isoform X2 [Malania oleifera]|nr:uncharacterized protein LOC131157620 isoform X2 [Malania oleifera]